MTGKIKNIKVEDTSQLAGGAMSKSVPRPKADDNREYMRSLTEEYAFLVLTISGKMRLGKCIKQSEMTKMRNY